MAKNFVKQTWDSAPPLVKTGIVIGAGFLAYKVGRKQYDNYKTRQRLKLYQQSQVNYTVVSPTAGAAAQSINLATTANEIYDSLYNNDPLGWTEDETRAVDAVKVVPKAFIPQLAQTYNQLYQKDLQADLVAALDSDEWAKISYLFS